MNNKLYIIISVIAAIVIAGGGWKIYQNKAAEEARIQAQIRQEEQIKQAAQEAAAKQDELKKDQKENSVKMLLGFEDRLKSMADKINSGESNTTVVPVGNILKDDINSEIRKLKKDSATDEEKEVAKMLDIQWRRADCMLRGVRGYTNAFAEGGTYYDLFYEKFDKFRANKG